MEKTDSFYRKGEMLPIGMIDHSVIGFGFLLISASAVWVLRFLSQISPPSGEWTQGGLEFLLISSLIGGMGVLFRELMTQRKEHKAEIVAISAAHAAERKEERDQHAAEIERLRDEAMSTLRETLEEYRQRGKSGD